jgi:hypothetical protein
MGGGGDAAEMLKSIPTEQLEEMLKQVRAENACVSFR